MHLWISAWPYLEEYYLNLVDDPPAAPSPVPDNKIKPSSRRVKGYGGTMKVIMQ